ncbi:MAG TPA: ABC transporter permease [Nitrospiraceae bacterium]|nr:ABC transporter permease [Nitrospiraceae bacterium]
MGVKLWPEDLAGFTHRLQLIWVLALDELRRTYGGSLLGLSWIILKPVMLITLYTVLFGFVFQIRGGADQTTGEYILVLLSGLLPWQMFAEALTAATGAISSNVSLVTKILFPIEILPVIKVVSATVTGLVSLLVFVAVLIPLHHLGWAVLLLPFLLVAQLLFTVGLSWVLSAFNVAVRDTNQVLPFALTLGMFLSPVVYTSVMVPHPLAVLFSYNPMSYFLEGYRAIFLTGQSPPVDVWLLVGGLSAATCLSGWWIFGRMRLLIADYL